MDSPLVVIEVLIVLVGPPILAAAALSRRLPDKFNSAGGNADAPPQLAAPPGTIKVEAGCDKPLVEHE
jgi:hypothetical protein